MIDLLAQEKENQRAVCSHGRSDGRVRFMCSISPRRLVQSSGMEMSLRFLFRPFLLERARSVRRCRHWLCWAMAFRPAFKMSARCGQSLLGCDSFTLTPISVAPHCDDSLHLLSPSIYLLLRKRLGSVASSTLPMCNDSHWSHVKVWRPSVTMPRDDGTECHRPAVTDLTVSPSSDSKCSDGPSYSLIISIAVAHVRMCHLVLTNANTYETSSSSSACEVARHRFDCTIVLSEPTKVHSSFQRLRQRLG